MRTPSTQASGPANGGLPRAAPGTTSPGPGCGLFTTALSTADGQLFGGQEATDDNAPGVAASGSEERAGAIALEAERGDGPSRGADLQASDMALQISSVIDSALLLAQSGFAGAQIRSDGPGAIDRAPLPADRSAGALGLSSLRSSLGADPRDEAPTADLSAAGTAVAVDRATQPPAAGGVQLCPMAGASDELPVSDAETIDAMTAGAAKPGSISAPPASPGAKSMRAAAAWPGTDASSPSRTQGRADAEAAGTTGEPKMAPHPDAFAGVEAGPQAQAPERTVARVTASTQGSIELAPGPAPVSAALELRGLPRTGRYKPEATSGVAPLAEAASAATLAATPVMSASAPSQMELAGAYRTPAEHLVSQLSWWLSQNAQGADFQIDLPGGQLVSVSVQIRGNEAQVAFHSDQPEIRQVLTQALPQLKDAFGHEGLLLSGASVGGNADGRAADRSDARQPRGPAIPSAGVSESAAATAAVRSLSASPSGRSLDLYV